MARDNNTAEVGARHLVSSEIRKTMAKADLKEIEICDFREEIGRCIERARILSGLSQKEFADKVKRDAGQIGRWISGKERPQFDAIFAVEELRGPLVIALAELSQTVEVETTLRIRRSA
jgi:ribosome-binding protein aMBF1 (putative translation factor)